MRVKKERELKKSDLLHINNELATLNEKMNKLLSICENTKSPQEIKGYMETIDSLREAIEITSSELEVFKREEAERLIFRSRVKWAEEGEKSNKYFLNIIKERQAKMQIRKIISNGRVN